MPPKSPSILTADDEAIAWATRLDGGNLTPADLATLNSWLAVDPSRQWRLAHYQQLYAQLHGTLPAMAAAGALALDLTPVKAPVRRWGRLVSYAGLAAAIVVGTVLWLQRPKIISTDTAQRQSVTLDDGTRIDLNARTRLTVDLRRNSRHVRLEGEAVFNVAKNPSRPFFVETTSGTVRVTGTVFDVRATPSGSLAVAVLEGRVLVQPVDGAGHEVDTPPALLAGDQLNFEAATGALQIGRPASIEDVMAWREGRVVFAGTPLREALERFGDYQGRVITVAPEAAELTLGGRYTLDDFDHFIGSLEHALPVRVLKKHDGSLRVVAAPRVQ